VRRYNHNNNVVVIAGPTGIGKSNVAQLLCKSMNGEIILGDSVQVCADTSNIL
jgi:tRNA A37 N6-isopentenylltransferase MiaA